MFKLESETGSIAKGKLAELALIDGDPSKNIGDLRQVTFERTGDAGGDRLGAGAWKLRTDRDGRIVDLRQRRDRQFRECQDTGQGNAEREQSRCHRPCDEWR